MASSWDGCQSPGIQTKARLIYLYIFASQSPRGNHSVTVIKDNIESQHSFWAGLEAAIESGSQANSWLT